MTDALSWLSLYAAAVAAAVGPLAISWLGLLEMTWLGLGKWRGQLHGGGLSSWTGAIFLSQTAGIIAWKWSSTRPLFFRRTTFDIAAAAADCDSGLTWDTNLELKLLPATIGTRFRKVEPTAMKLPKDLYSFNVDPLILHLFP